MNIPYIDNVLNRITMYRLVLYYLVVLVAVAAIYGLFGVLPYSPVAILFSTVFLVAACWLCNKVFARIFNAHPGTESAYITALILSLIVTPVLPSDFSGVVFLFVLALLANASKYILAINKKHLFNPAAFAVAVSALALGQYASWWVGGNLPLLPFVLVGGLLVVRKLQRLDLVLSFGTFALGTIMWTSLPQNPFISIQQTLLHSSFFFLAFVMLTEPTTTPPNKKMRCVYGAVVGYLFAPATHIASLYITPELALLVGNVFAYVVSPKGRLMLTFIAKEKIGEATYNFVFTTRHRLTFLPGQYLEWTLPHQKPDTRGNRRYFTIASSPTEKELRLGTKFYKPASSFKLALWRLKPGDTVSAAQLAGDFTLPKDPKQKLVFIAGGIGITPFRAMVEYLRDTKDKRNVVLLYSNKNPADAAYKYVFDRAAQEINVKTVYTDWIDTELIHKEVPDWRQRLFYISGPRAMVVAFEKNLADLGVPRRRIKVDFFPGFV